MNPLGYITIALGILVALLIALTLSRIKDRKIIASCLYGFHTLLVMLVFAVLLLVFSNLNTYNRLVYEREIVEVLIKQNSEQRFQIRFIDIEQSLVVSGRNDFQLSGDEWRLDARIIKWKGWANLIGLDSFYRLDRLSGRYSDIEQASSLPTSVYRLSGPQKGLNIWGLKKMMKSRLPFLDTYFGQSVFVPMRDGARYRLSLSQSGLVVRPANEAAKQALDSW